MKLFKKKSNPNDDFLAQEAKEEAATAADYTLDIPDDEIWSYQIEGLQAPAINKSYKKATGKKLLVIVILLIAISCSIFLSVRAVHSDEFDYKQLDNSSYQLTKYSNPGEVTEVTVDYVDGDKSKPVSTIYEYAFNCDEKLTQITIGKDVKSIDAKAIYSCWALQNIYVDDDNPYYCDLDGVLYNKDKTEIILYPIDHDRYLRLQTGYAYKDKDGVQHSKMVDDSGAEMGDLWGTTNKYDEKYLEKYNQDVRTYVLPSTVTKIGELSFAYANITDLYIPEGVKTIETMGIFKAVIQNLYTYRDSTATGTTYKDSQNLKNVYNSLPNGLEYIGSDAFTYDSGLTYMYIPSSVKHIGHHAFWDTVTKTDGNLAGVTAIEVESDESTFKENVETGDHWRPQYDYMAFHKNVDVNYSAQRK